ncbi:MAG: cation-transporting P-type ATPase [Mycobacterium sp.]
MITKHLTVDLANRRDTVARLQTVTAEAKAERLAVDLRSGRSTGQVAARLTQIGPNRLIQPRRLNLLHVLSTAAATR